MLARSDMTSFADSLVAPLSLINALMVAIGIRRRDEISATFSHLEKVWEEYEVYEDDQKDGEKKLQDLTDKYIKNVEDMTKKKEEEILSI